MAYSAVEQEAAAAAVKPILWARLSINHTKKTCALSCAVPLLALLVVIFSGALSIDSPESTDYIIRNDKRTILEDGRLAALDEYPYVEKGAPADGKTLERGDGNSYFSLTILFRGRIGNDGPIGVMNETSDDATNILTKKGLALMKKAEDDMLSDPDYSKYCKYDPEARDCAGEVRDCVLPQSILISKHLYGIWAGEGDDSRPCGRQEGSEEVSDEAFESFMNSLFEPNSDGEPRPVPQYSQYFGTDLDQDRRTWIAKSYFEVGEPFKGYSNEDDRPDDQQKEFETWASDAASRINDLTTPEIDVFLIGGALIEASFGSIVLRDLSFSIAAIVLVFIVIWIHTTSAFLAATAMAQIFLAFPIAYLFYKYVFRQDYFAALQILVIFLILGIGADDVFVFTDAWKQSAVVLGSTCDLVTRMSWTYRRAVKAMSVTSVTTAAAFFVTATSPIMPIGTLGVWAGVLILLQFLLVITIYPCAVAVWHRFWRVRNLTNCFRKPVDVDNDQKVSFWYRCLPVKWRPEPKLAGVDEYRKIETFFRGPWIAFIRRFRFPLLVLAVALVAVCIYLATRLQPPKESENFLPESNELRVAFAALEDDFPRSDADLQLAVRITWGIKGTDRSGTSKFDTSDPGTAILDSNFDLKTAAAQQHVLKACSFFRNQKNLIFQEPTISDDERVECWIQKFKDWRGKEEFETYDKEVDLIKELIKFGNDTTPDGRQPNLKYLSDQHIAFTKGLDSVVFTEIRFVSPVEAAAPYKIMWPVYEEWQDQLEIFNNKAPESVKDSIGSAIATGGYSWTWQITQRSLVRSMFVGIAVMLAVALVALTFSTLNWAVAILATMAIAGIVAMLLGIIKLLGWNLGITESIGVVIAVGYSFDGAAHIATAYVESRNNGQFDQTRDALTDLGISILFGAITTLLAGFMLFPAIIIFFVKFAGLIVATVSLGLIWSLIFLPTLLLIVGPIGDFGSIPAMLRKTFKRFRKNRSSDDSDQPQVEGKEELANESQEDSIE